jgi:hypothetical protein
MLYTVISLLIFLSISYTGATYAGNYALSFDGLSSIVKIGHMYTDLALSNTWTLEAYIKPYGDQGTVYQPNIVGFPKRHPNLELCGHSLTQPGCPGFPMKTLAQLRDTLGNYFTMLGQAGTIGDTTNTWYHVAATWNNATFTTYVNGVQDAISTPYSTGYTEPLNCSFPLCDEGIDIGGYRFLDVTGAYYSGQYFKGLIDEVRVWNLGRTGPEIQSTMKTVLTGNEGGLVYYWRFDEGKGLLVNSQAFVGYGTLGGGITAAEPRWVESDSPLDNPYPSPQTPAGNNCTPCNCNEAGVYVAGTILGLVFIVVGVIIGIVAFKKIGNYQPLK